MNNNNNNIPEVPIVEPTNNIEPQVNNVNTTNNIGVQPLQNAATIEQSKYQFINKIQSEENSNKKEEKKGMNWAFIIILFILIFAAIFFLFPYLIKTL